MKGDSADSVASTSPKRRKEEIPQPDMTEEAYVFYGWLAQESPDDLSAQARLWSALRRIALQSLEIGDMERARILADRVRELVDASYDLHPDDPILQREMMHLHVTLAVIAGDAKDGDMVEGHVNRSAELCELITSWHERYSDLDAPETLVVRQSGPEAGTMTDYVQVRREWAFLLPGDSVG